jgi:hypothetical protein
MKVLISAMLRPAEGEALVTIRDDNHVEKHDTPEAEFRNHPPQSVLANDA